MTGELTNHLWQSTFFAVAAGLMAIAFRKNRAHIRYGLWLSASLKFLVPFSLLISLGSHLAWAPAPKTIAMRAVSLTMVQITQPFPDNVSFAASAPHITDWPLIAIFGAWVCGFGVVAAIRFKDWLGIRAAMRLSTRLEPPAAVEVRSTASLLEPGVVGLFHPILLLPEGIVGRLTPPQLEAVFAHELCHVRRRDNLTAAVHMVVEAIFWFHPMVWWIGARLIAEREQACDEEVLRLGNAPHVYAESILNVCKFYVESPVTCVSGVTGSDLKKRVARIMRNDIGAMLSGWGKLGLVTAGAAALAAPIAAGALIYPRPQVQSDASSQRVIGAGPLHFRYFFQEHPSHAAPQGEAAAGGKMSFDVASVKENKSGPPPSGDPPRSNVGLTFGDDSSPNGGRLSVTNFPLSFFVGFAYKLTPYQTLSLRSQLPKWATTESFDIEAKSGSNPTKDQMRLMMQSLLVDRFKLAIHNETRQLPVLALLLARSGKTGPQLLPHSNDPPCYTGPPAGAPGLTPEASAKAASGFAAVCGAFIGLPPSVPGRMRRGGRNMSMDQVAGFLAVTPGNPLDRPVVDRTGLTGSFDFTIEYTPEFSGPAPPNFQADPTGLTFVEALQEQLGLKLEPQKVPVNVLVIDHIEEPSPN